MIKYSKCIQKFNIEKEVLIVQNYISQVECKQIINNLNKRKKKLTKRNFSITPGVSKNFVTLEKNNKNKKERAKFNFSLNLWSKYKSKEYQVIRKLENDIYRTFGYKKLNPWKIDKKHFIQGYAFQYFYGGGNLPPHRDVLFGIREVTPLLNLTLESNSFSGGLHIEIKGKKINCEKYLSPGDVLVLGKNIKHWVETINKKEKFNFLSKKGKWTLVPSVQKNLLFGDRYSVTKRKI